MLIECKFIHSFWENLFIHSVIHELTHRIRDNLNVRLSNAILIALFT